MSNLNEKELITIGRNWLESLEDTRFYLSYESFTDEEFKIMGNNIAINNLPRAISKEDKIKFKRF